MGENSRRTIQNIQDAPWLSASHVHIRNPEKVVEKINRITANGKEKMQVIFDFDRTLTKHHENGVITQSSFGILESMPCMPKDFQRKSKESLEKFRPIETDPLLTMEEKLPYMLEWWKSGIEMLKGLEWEPSLLDECVKQNQPPFRDGTNECFHQLNNSGVPVLVFSAGIGDVVQFSLKHQGLLTPNVHVVSNFLKIVDGRITGYVGDIIHVFNKNEQLIENTSYFEELAGRSNVILLGDSTGDTTMADGVPHDTVLKIGFLNTNIEESLPQYKELFDIVLADDQTMDVLNHILKPSV